MVEVDRSALLALDPLNTAENQVEKLLKMGELLVKSGFLPDAIKQPPQAVAIILTGREMGIPMMQALRQINVIQGKPTVSAELMLSQAYRAVPGFTHEIIERSETKCQIKFKAKDRADYIHEFTMKDAEGMGLAHKDNWKKQPKVMLFWRCVSGGLRAFVPQAVNGVYTTEELAPDEVTVTDAGEAVLDTTKLKKPKITPAAVEAEKAVEEAKSVKPEEEKVDDFPKSGAAAEPEAEPALDNNTVLKMLAAFKSVDISKEELENFLGRTTGQWYEADRVNLLNHWKKIKAGELTKEQFLA